MTSPGSWQQRVQAAWLHRGPLAAALLPLAAAYAGLTLTRRALYAAGVFKRHAVPVPVVVVGNVIAGGAGKTPTAMSVVRHLQQQGRRPGIVSRGYGGTPAREPREVHRDSLPREVGDEPLLMHLRTGAPTVVCADRVAAAAALLQAHPEVDVLVCDDGLQHLRLARDVEIIVFDERGAGNGWWLPAGPLRESAARAADLVLYNAPAPSTPRPGFLARRALAGAVPLAAWRGGQRQGVPLAGFKACRVLAVAAVAHPQRFFGMLRTAGLEIDPLPLADHHAYDELPWHGWDGDAILVTEKDAVKLHAASDPRIHVVALDFEPDPAFFATLDRLLASRAAHIA